MDRGEFHPMSWRGIIRAAAPAGISPGKWVASELSAATGEEVSCRQGERYYRVRVPAKFRAPLRAIVEAALAYSRRQLDRAESDLKAIDYDQMVGRAKARRMEADHRMAREAAERARPKQPALNFGGGGRT